MVTCLRHYDSVTNNFCFQIKFSMECVLEVINSNFTQIAPGPMQLHNYSANIFWRWWKLCVSNVQYIRHYSVEKYQEILSRGENFKHLKIFNGIMVPNLKSCHEQKINFMLQPANMLHQKCFIFAVRSIHTTTVIYIKYPFSFY